MATKPNPRRTPKPITFAAVREIGLALPGAEEGTAYGSPALKTRGARGKSEMFACLPSHKSAEPDSLAVRISFDQRQELLDTDPATFYITNHYVNYPCVLVRLGQVHPGVLRDLLHTAHRFVSQRPLHNSSRRTPRPRRPQA